MPERYRIRMVASILYMAGSPLWWSNDSGWGSRKCSDLFTLAQKKKFNLPVGGEWIKETSNGS